MSDSTKTIVFDGAGSSNNTFDPNYLLGMMMGNGGFGGGFGNGSWIWVLFLFALFGGNWGGFGGWGNNGFGGNGAGFLSNQINEDTGRQLVMQAINGNRDAIAQLSTTLHCSIGDIQTALTSIQGKICDVANQVGMSSLQVINAIDRGDSALASQLASCCCDLKTAILESNYLTERGFCNTNQILTRGFSDLGYAFKDQTCELEKTGSANTAAIIAKLDAIEDSRKDRELAEKDRMIATLTARSERQAELQPIYSALHEIQCNQPPVKKIACPETYVPVNNAINATYGLVPTYGCGFGAGYGYGFPGWNNGNTLWG